MFALQIITYSFVLIIDIILTLTILGVQIFDNSAFATFFVVLALITFALLCVVNIIARKNYRNQIDESEEEMITIKKSEYDMLLKKATLYDNSMENKVND